MRTLLFALLGSLMGDLGAAPPKSAQQRDTATMVAVQDLSWSFDGQSLFFSAMRVKSDYSDYAPDKWAVYRYDVATARVVRVAASSFSVAASPGGGRIAVGKLVGDNRDIYILDEGGREITRLTTHPAEEFGPAWSPDERRIAFTSKRDGHAEIYRIDADGSGERRLTRNDSARSYNPSWSPDGRRLAYYLEQGDGRDQIFVMNADGTDATNVTNDAFNNVFPGWTPDGQILYGRSLKGAATTQVFVVDPHGRNKRPLLGLDSFYARYSPDGSRIAYTAMTQREGARLQIVSGTGAPIATVALGMVGSDAGGNVKQPPPPRILRLPH